MEFRRKARNSISFRRIGVVETCRNTVLVQALYIAGRKNTTAKEDGLK
jgi:hypothetical protein